MEYCYGCGEPLDTLLGNHKCCPKKIARIEGARKAHGNIDKYFCHSYAHKMSLGIFIRNLNDDKVSRYVR